jgi:predicted dehydrogenase
MNLTPEQQAIGRRNFLKALAGTPALAALGAAAAVKGPVRGGPVNVGVIGVGAQGRVHVENVHPAYADIRAFCDINPASLEKADQILAKKGRPAPRHYVEWRDMLHKEDLEAVILAPPLWMHAEIASGCLDAGKHVLCEKMMAWDVAGCEQMMNAARKNGRVLEIGYQRNYNPIYQAAYDGIVKPGVLGDIYHVRLAWHRNGNWRRAGDPPAPGYDPSRWGYPTFDHLWNWRLYWRYSQGLFAELASHQLNVVNWFFGATPTVVSGSGGLYRYHDGKREVYDHVYATFEYPGGRTVTFTSIESNAFDQYYEAYFGTNGTLILERERDAFLFEEGAAAKPTGLDVSPKSGGPALDASESRPANAPPTQTTTAAQPGSRPSATRYEIIGFCEAIRVNKPLKCGPERAIHSARACILANEAIKKQGRVTISSHAETL